MTSLLSLNDCYRLVAVFLYVFTDADVACVCVCVLA